MSLRLAVALVLLALGFAAFAAEDKPEQVVKARAQELASAALRGDFSQLLDLTYPKIIEQGGGHRIMLQQMKDQMVNWRTKGYQLIDVKVGEPSPPVAGSAALFAVVPLTLKIKIPGGTLTASSFLLGISENKGKMWTFIDGGKISDAEVKKLLPQLPSSLKLPKKEKTKFSP